MADFSDVTVKVDSTAELIGSDKPDWLRQGVRDLFRHEGYRRYAYPDPLSTLHKKYPPSKYGWGFRPAREILKEIGQKEIYGQPWTVGVGQTHGVTPDSEMSIPEAAADLELSVKEHVRDLHKLYSGWETAPDFVSSVLVDMIYNLGYQRLKQFQPTIDTIKAGKYEEAATRLKKTAWHRQVGDRAVELETRLERQRIAPEHRVT